MRKSYRIAGIVVAIILFLIYSAGVFCAGYFLGHSKDSPAEVMNFYSRMMGFELPQNELIIYSSDFGPQGDGEAVLSMQLTDDQVSSLVRDESVWFRLPVKEEARQYLFGDGVDAPNGVLSKRIPQSQEGYYLFFDKLEKRFIDLDKEYPSGDFPFSTNFVYIQIGADHLLYLNESNS